MEKNTFWGFFISYRFSKVNKKRIIFKARDNKLDVIMSQKEKKIEGECTVTNIEAKENDFSWVIENFSHCCIAYEQLTSPVFTTGDKDQFEWKIVLDLADNFILNLRVQLIKDSDNKLSNMYVSLSFLGNDNKEKFTTKFKSLNHNALSVKKAFILNRSSHLLFNDALTIKFRVYFCNHTNTTLLSSYFIRPKVKFSDELESLVNNENNGDVKILIGERSLYTPKSLLSANSPFFSKFLANKVAEASHIVIEMNDCTYEIVLEILRFLHCGRVINLEDLSLSLYDAACKYQIVNLKQLCDETIFKGVSLANISQILILADRYKIERLTNLGINFLKKHKVEVVQRQLLNMICPYVSPELVMKVIDELKN